MLASTTAGSSCSEVTEEHMALKDATTSDNVLVHGVIRSLSPMKKEKAPNFFHANLTDGETQMCLVGFQDAQRKRLASFLHLLHCKIKCAWDLDDYEVLLKPTVALK